MYTVLYIDIHVHSSIDPDSKTNHFQISLTAAPGDEFPGGTS